MPNPEAETIDRLHHWFAVECNNQGWNLTTLAERTEAQDRELLQCAYAAAWHWSKVGEAIHDARADMLISQAHALLGDAEPAMQHAQRCLDYCEHEPCEPWDIAFAHAGMALAASTAGDPGLAEHHLEQARLRGDEIADADDQQVFCMEFQRVVERVTRRRLEPGT